ncbi:MAG: AMP-binding protein [Gammaproteobacteria bacterium]|nr:AMP-binding protein [Gammaproteobacteria bacterium]
MQLEHWIAYVASRTPDKTAIRFEGEQITYSQFEGLIGRLAWVLQNEFQVSPGDRVAHLALNSPIVLALIFACARIGAILVPLNYRLAHAELTFLLGDCNPKVLFSAPQFLAGFVAGQGAPATCRLVAIDDADSASDWDSLADYLGGQEIQAERQDQSDPSAPVLIVYTSGTTGRPKGAVLDQNALRWNAINSQHMHALSGDDHILTVLPFYHVGGLNVQTLPALHFGATVTLHREFDAAAVLSEITGSAVTLTVLVPTQMRAIGELPHWPATDLSVLRAVTTGSTIVEPGLLQAWEQRGVRTLQVYGCTESCPIAVCQSIDDAHSPLESVGREAKHCRARVVDEHQSQVGTMVRGEIQLQGQNLMREYWNNPEATANALRDGWLATGDIGYRDDDGNFYIVDRIKNIIISGGENIFPAEIEHVLYTHPDIEQAAIVGLPDETWGEIVAASIVKRPGATLDQETLLEFLGDRLGRYKLPRRLFFESELPRNAMGKTDYQALRDRLIDRA